MRVRSSLRSSLQQTPSSRVVLAHLAARGVDVPDSEAIMGQTEGLWVLCVLSVGRLRGTMVGVEEREDWDMVVQNKP